MILVASFPFEDWAVDMQTAFLNVGIEAEVEAGGDRAWQIYVSEENEEAAALLLENTSYLNCAR